MRRAEAGELEELRSRRREACERFVDRHYAEVYRFFCWLTRDVEAAADLTQETFAAFWVSVADPPDKGAPPDLKAWLYGIARNRWRKRCRRLRAEQGRQGAEAETEETLDPAPGPEVRVLAELELEQVGEAVGALPADYREALVLRVFQDLEYPQIGRVLGITEGLARWRVHRGRRLLQGALAKAERDGSE